MKRKYAAALTKERLIKEGFTEITTDGRMFKGDVEVFPHWNSGRKSETSNKYLCISLYQRDPEGHLIKGKDRIYKRKQKDGSIKEYVSWQAKLDTIGLHRIMWAWHYGEVPEGFVVDHIDNKHLTLHDYRLENLQLQTPQQNVTKDKACNVRQIKCKLNKPRIFYEDKLKHYTALHEQAKEEGNATEAHKKRTLVAQTKARLRYYDAHIEEALRLQQDKEAEELTRASKATRSTNIAQLKTLASKAKACGHKNQWHQLLSVVRNYDAFTPEQIETIIKNNEERYNEQ